MSLNRQGDDRDVRNIAGHRHYTALLDTGAEIPVFTYGSANMRALGGKLASNDGSFTGFGGEQVVDPDDLEPVPTKGTYRPSGAKMRGQDRDVVSPGHQTTSA